MRAILGRDPIPEDCRGGVAAIGNFDGLHRGHQALLGVAGERAAGLGAPWGLVTFEPHPRSFFRPGEPVFRLTSLALKLRLLAALGAGFACVLDFDAALAGLEAEDFVRGVLHERLGLRLIVTGYDFHFGRGRKGSTQLLRELGPRFGFETISVEQITGEGSLAPFASSAIRSELRHGRVREAAKDLGYWWSVMGTVVEGDKRGRSIGFPTLNIALDPGVEPAEGIYAVRVRRGGEPESVWKGAGYYGKRPTFETGRYFLEVFLLDFTGDLYGETLTVEFIAHIRGDRTFESVAALTRQMEADCQEARRLLDETERDDPMLAYPLGRMQALGEI